MSSRLEDILNRRMPRHAVADMESIMSTEAGRRFVASVVFDMSMWGCRTLDPAIKDGGCSTKHQDFVDGMQEVGRRLAYEARQHCRHLWRQMERERLARDEQDETTQREKETRYGSNDE